MLPWNDVLTLLNTIDTVLGGVFLVISYIGLRFWWDNRHAQAGHKAVESSGSEDAQEDESPWRPDW